MTSVTYAVNITPKDEVKIETAEDLSNGSEYEKRFGRLIKIAVDAAAEEILHHMKEGIMIEKDGIAQKAREVMKVNLEKHEND